MNEIEVKNLENKGAEVHRFDMRKNLMKETKKQYPNLGAYAIASRFNLNKNTYKSGNKSMDGKHKRRHISSLFKGNHKKDLNNSSVLPDIKENSKRRIISQVRRDQGEYSKLLSNHENNRLVQAQKTVDHALRKFRDQNPNKNQRNKMMNDIYRNKKNLGGN